MYVHGLNEWAKEGMGAPNFMGASFSERRKKKEEEEI